MIFSARAHPNIAFIKYMGKKDSKENLPSNPSLSYRLKDFFSEVHMEKSKVDEWVPLKKDFVLDKKAQKKFLDHWLYLKDKFSIKENMKISSFNNFPSSCGLSSSSSSYAALTLCAHKIFQSLNPGRGYENEELSSFSRKGSGSSCRSFFPWALWEKEGATSLKGPFLSHMVLIKDRREKSVLSSKAHERVKTSPFYEKRKANAEKRIKTLKTFLEADELQKNWKEAFQIIYLEFEEMHELFRTSAPPFDYFTDKTLDLLKTLKKDWESLGDGPLITMDAGHPIHLFFRKDQRKLHEKMALKFKDQGVEVLEGARC